MTRIFRLACSGSLAIQCPYLPPCFRRTRSAINWSKSIGVAAILRSLRKPRSLQSAITFAKGQAPQPRSIPGIVRTACFPSSSLGHFHVADILASASVILRASSSSCDLFAGW